MELSYAGKLNIFWFIVSLISIILAVGESTLYYPFIIIPSVVDYFWHYLIGAFVVMNRIIKVLYIDFDYKCVVRSCLLGTVFSAGVFIAWTASPVLAIFGWYLCVLSNFHFSEFLAIAWCNPSSLSVSSFILNHSVQYWIALIASWLEFSVEAYLFPGLKTSSYLSWIGLSLCVIGEILRKTAMFTAAANFDHLVQLEKKENHQLVTTGVYSLCRHPSYVGWYLFSIGTQMLLLNPVCFIAYSIVSWQFFRERIIMEEWYLLDFFQEDYMKYQQKVGTGIPFIEGLVIKSSKNE